MARKQLRIALFSMLVLSAIALGMFAAAAPDSPLGATAAAAAGQSTTPDPTTNPTAAQTLQKLCTVAGLQSGTQMSANVSRLTGVYDFVRAEGSASSVLVADNATLTAPETRARNFLGSYGGLFGMTDAERNLVKTPGTSTTTLASALSLTSVYIDGLGASHVKFDQTYQGLKVFGAQLVVHMNAFGIKGVNGNFVPGINISKTPKVSASRAGRIAVAAASKSPGEGLSVVKSELAVYRMGLIEGYKGRNVLAYAVEVAGQNAHEQVWVNANTGNVILRVPMREDILHRIVYSPSFDPNNPNSNKIREEGDPTILPPPSDPPDNLYAYAGQIYNLYRSAFGRDSFDGVGLNPQRTVLLVNDQCPNAYWDGSVTNYCPDFDKDDVVAHEWTHAYTQHTDNLIYAYQPGALNEAWSDIFGESVDLNNGVDGAGGSDNAHTTTYAFDSTTGQYAVSGGGVRWRVGEDVTGLSQPAALGILRDMWFPEAFGDPGKVSSTGYYCGTDQGTEVHTNSGVPNHAFALMVDGTSSLPDGKYNGVAVDSIGFTRALAVYFRAMTTYQTSSTNFAQHAQAMHASCTDLIGAPLNNISLSSAVGTPSTETINAATCQAIDNAMAAVEMSAPPKQCNFQKLLDPDTPEECPGSNTFFAEDWETGMDGWTLGTLGTGDAWANTNWTTKSDLPANLDGSPHTGTAAFAINPQIGEPNGGTCSAGGDVSGHFWMDSPEIVVPAGAGDPKLAFQHFVQTEAGFDGGNVKVSVNGGAFTVVPQSDYVFNQPNFTAPSGMPLSGEAIWNGSNGGEVSGSWGTTIVDLSSLTSPGDHIKIRFDFGQDACNGNLGWFVDNVRLYNCPLLNPPTLSVGSDYGNPDRDGKFTLNWTRPAGAVGPDLLQESTTCGPVFTDDASENLVGGANSKWTGSAQWTTQPNPSSTSSSYFIPDGAQQNESLTLKNAITIPAGASATLTFTTRQGLEDGFDFGYVEVSTDGGANYAQVASYTGPADDLDPLTVFEGARNVNLSQFAGQSIKIRFRVTSDPFNIGAPAGWYIDDIAVTASTFHDAATALANNTYTFTHKADGNFCYRVRTAYQFGQELADSPFSNVANISVANIVCLTNVAASANGATAVASSTYDSRSYPASSAINGERAGANWENGGGWNDATRDTYPDWLEVDFSGSKRIHQINVYTLQDNFKSPQEPTPLMTTSLYGLLDFDVQYFDGANWVTVPGGSITNNNLVMNTLIFEDITTTKIRVFVSNARSHFSRVTEVEAIGCDAQP